MEELSNDEFLATVRREAERRLAEDPKGIEANVLSSYGSPETTEAKLLALLLVLR
jgi:hypothetical protein